MDVLYIPSQNVHSIILINFTKNMKLAIDVEEVEELLTKSYVRWRKKQTTK